MTNNKKYELRISLFASGEDLKKLFISKHLTNYDENKIKIRIFFAGSEILNSHKLMQHNIKEEYTLQMALIEIIEEKGIVDEIGIVS